MLMGSFTVATENENTLAIACDRDSPLFALARQLLAQRTGRLIATVDELVETCATTRPGALVVDQRLLAGDELAILEVLGDVSPQTVILLVVSDAAPEAWPGLMQYGVRGFCRGDTTASTLSRAVDMLLAGAIWIPRDLMPTLVDRLQVAVRAGPREAIMLRARFDSLTPRQIEIAQMVSDGANNKEIARTLGISDRTVKAHLTAVFERLGISSRLNLALLYKGLKRHP